MTPTKSSQPTSGESEEVAHLLMVPLDGSSVAEQALPVAAAITHRSGAKVQASAARSKLGRGGAVAPDRHNANARPDAVCTSSAIVDSGSPSNMACRSEATLILRLRTFQLPFTCSSQTRC